MSTSPNAVVVESFPVRDLHTGTMPNGQPALFCGRGLVATMEAGAHSARLGDAAALVAACALAREADGLQHERDVARAACAHHEARIAELEAALAAVTAQRDQCKEALAQAIEAIGEAHRKASHAGLPSHTDYYARHLESARAALRACEGAFVAQDAAIFKAGTEGGAA